MPVYTLTVNGEERVVDAPADMPLLYVLRDLLGITGPKYGCGVGICGACTSHIGDNVARPCIVPIQSIGAQPVTTIEGLANGGVLHPVQQAWIDEDVAQCGFCQPGQIMTAVRLLEQHSNPTDAQIDAAMSENVCRCGTYVRIRAAIKRAAAASGSR
ncbi:(2Fe-2S)-binding protein [Steroidobacter agaridevorans]|uniref:(2Fe-2S)-binding protein n=1 Tax=Steroidobacter agaridevorans TaxID=2695856 RepID=UPI00132C8967|nr:(2Fe-2S)-binding protein [Steroidobacter agaridevorans]GFE87626.1 isoquinoline 1-oxidoreductase subunit alpha [Steroidobacter agaridevorans]